MDFINIRKEISSELRTIDSRMKKQYRKQDMSKTSVADKGFKVKTSKSFK